MGRPRKTITQKYKFVKFGKCVLGIEWARGYISPKYNTRYDVKLDNNTGQYWIYNIFKDIAVKQGYINPNTKHFRKRILVKIRKDLKRLYVPFEYMLKRRPCQKKNQNLVESKQLNSSGNLEN